MEKNSREAFLQRFARNLEREARIAGVDVEPEITKILEKIDGIKRLPKGQE